MVLDKGAGMIAWRWRLELGIRWVCVCDGDTLERRACGGRAHFVLECAVYEGDGQRTRGGTSVPRRRAFGLGVIKGVCVQDGQVPRVGCGFTSSAMVYGVS